MKKKLQYTLLSISALALFFLAWYMMTDLFHLVPSTSLPSPAKVVDTFIIKLSQKAPDGGTIGMHIVASLKVALSGFALGCIIGIPLGVFMAWYEKFDLLAKPVFDFVRTIPSIAWIPIMIVLLGIGIFAKASIVFLSAFIPCVINSYTGIKTTKNVHIWVAQTFCASKLTILRKVALPTALPFIFTGMKVSLNASWTSLLAAEMLGSSEGLGFMIQIGRLYIRSDIIVVGMIVIGAIGFLLSAVLDFIESKLVKGGIN